MSEMAENREETRLLRRARREARRAKQREANAGRAVKMHRARINASPTPGLIERAPPGIVVGCSGWFYWHWRDRFYPSALPTRDWFKHYSTRFKTVELNAPFYSWPTVGTVNSWKRQAGRRQFIYTVKVCELITHVKRFSGTRELIRDFYYIAELLGSRMGCFLFQLPPSFKYTPARLKRILEQLDPRYRNVVEFRHRSWWKANVYAAFKKAKVIFCSTSGPGLPDELVKTADDIYIRFHGRKRWYVHDYSKEEVAEWVARIKQSGATRVWAYFNNDRDGNAIKNARELSRQLRR
jgi:uncharacterized protein YecE (DUF72 family)